MTLRARFPLSRVAAAAADAAVRDKTQPPGRKLDPRSPEDAALRNEWMAAYAEAGGAVDRVGTSAAAGSPVKPCERFIELRYLHCDGTPVKGAKVHIRADGFAVDTDLNDQGFIRLDGVPPLAGFTYGFSQDREVFVPLGPKLPTASPAVASQTQAAVQDLLDWLGGALQGDFNPDPSFGQIAFNALLGLVPVVDQAMDIRDLVAGILALTNFYTEDAAAQASHDTTLGLSHESWLWLGLLIIAIGCIPEAGSAAKGVIKTLLKLLQDAGQAAGKLAPRQLRAIWEALVKVLNGLGAKAGNVHEWLKQVPDLLDKWATEAAKTVQAAAQQLMGKLDSAQRWGQALAVEAVDRARRQIEALKAALGHISGQCKTKLSQLGAWLKEQLNKVLGGKHSVESSGNINTKAGHEGPNVRQQEKAPAPAPEIPPKPKPKADDPYAVAKAGGKHGGFLKNYEGKSSDEIKKGIQSIEEQIADHRDKIANPEKHIPDFRKLDPRQQEALVNKKWPSDIKRQTEQLEILKGLLNERSP